MLHHWNVVFRQIPLHRERVGCWGVVVMKNPWGILPHVWSPSSHTFTEGRQNIFIINLIDSLTFRHRINVDNPPDIEKTIIIALNLDLLMRTFFFLWDWGLSQCMDCLLVSGSYWKIQFSSHVITFWKKSGSFSMFSRVSAQQFTWCFFCSG